MKLEELQTAWYEMSEQLEHQKKLTDNIIMEMTQKKYTDKFRTISLFETFGASICFIAALYIIVNFYKLNTWYLITCGIFSLLFLIVLPIFVLVSLYRIKNINITKHSFSDTLIHYIKEKNRLMLLQKLGIGASFIQLFAVAIVFAKILSNKDFFMVERDIWSYVFMGLAVVFIFLMARWGYNGYKKVTNSAEQLLKNLE